MTVNQIAEAFRKAAAAAQINATVDDNVGPCNCDSAVVQFPRMKHETIERAAALADVRVRRFDWMHSRWYSLDVTDGQGARRTAMAESAVSSLKASGLDAEMFYQMD